MSTSDLNKIKLASELTARALINTKSFVDIFRGNEESRYEPSQFFYHCNTYENYMKNKDALHFGFSESGELECFFMLMPNSMNHFSLWDHFMSGLLKFPFFLWI